ncbi:40833_t:CDS:2, partial [Gigaspora margarita]
HHVQNACNFGTLENISVEVKKIVHKIFKGSVSKMNCKNIEFDLIHQHNTLQMIRYLINGGEDNHFLSIEQGFQNFKMDLLLQPILSDWYMMQNVQEEEPADIKQYICCDAASLLNRYKKEDGNSSVSHAEFCCQIHIQSEQKRRAEIKDGFEQLRRQLLFNINNVPRSASTNKSKNDSLRTTGLKISDIRYSSCNRDQN